MSTSSGVIRCKAAVAWAAGEPLVVEEVELSPPEAMEIRLKVVFTSLCRSDLNAWLSQVSLSSSTLQPVTIQSILIINSTYLFLLIASLA